MRAALYARVSTSDRGQDTENQFTDFQQFCTEHQAEPLIYREEETGTGRKRRPVFEQMMQDAEAHRFSVLVIWALDRLTREGPLRAMLTLNRLYLAGVKVKSLRESWLDPDSPLYELMVPIMAWIAKQESQRMSERVLSGLARARAAGKTLGRRRLRPSRSKIAAMRRGGQSWRQVASQLKVSVNTCRRAFQKPSGAKVT